MFVVRFRYPRTEPGLDDFAPYLVQKVFLALPFHYILASLLVPPVYEIGVDMTKPPYHSVRSERMLPYLELLSKRLEKHPDGLFRTYVLVEIYFSSARNLPVGKKRMVLLLDFRRDFSLVRLYLVFNVLEVFRQYGDIEYAAPLGPLGVARYVYVLDVYSSCKIRSTHNLYYTVTDRIPKAEDPGSRCTPLRCRGKAR